MVGECCSAIDLILFRKHIAPALGITHRFVGTEPFCKTTRKYNDDMKQWLQVADSSAPAVSVVEVPRTVSSNIAISASEVRRLLRSGDMAKMPALVPRDTLNSLQQLRHVNWRKDP